MICEFIGFIACLCAISVSSVCAVMDRRITILQFYYTHNGYKRNSTTRGRCPLDFSTSAAAMVSISPPRINQNRMFHLSIHARNIRVGIIHLRLRIMIILCPCLRYRYPFPREISDSIFITYAKRIHY